MKIEDIFDLSGNSNIKKYYSFEAFVLALLEHHILKQEKHFIKGDKDRYDAYSETGFDDFIGSTVIELQLDVNRRNKSQQILKRHIVPLETGIINIDNIIIISATEVDEETRMFFNYYLREYNRKVKLTFWGPKEINQLISKNAKYANELANNIFGIRMEAAIKKGETDWKNERELIIEEIKDLYTKGQFSLFLGAGVSSSAGVSDWKTLINSLFVNYLTKVFDNEYDISDSDIFEIVTRLDEIDSQSALMSARYIKTGLLSNSNKNFDFLKEVKNQIYKLRDTEKPIDSTLIKSISRLCTPRRTGAKIRSIVTYNFDDLIERELEKSNNSFKSIFCDSDYSDAEQLPIYHAHGFLPEDNMKYKNVDRAPFVFTEDGYHKMYSEPYHWSNLVQLNSLRENTCLMIGLSMTDPNLRRLLDIAARNLEKPRHFAFMERLKLDKFINRDGARVISNEKSANSFLNNHFMLNQEIFKELGVTIIWVENYDEIPEILNRIGQIEL